MQLAGKTALITGGTSGIGLATAELFIAKGAKVIVTGRNSERLAALKTKFEGRVTVFTLDVNDEHDLKSVAEKIAQQFGDKSIDIYFANAGIAYSTPLGATLESRYDLLMNTNVKGVFFAMQAFLPLLNDGASVILNSAWLNSVGMAGFSALAASKAAVRSMARSWSADLVSRKIRVNCVSPGAIDTPIFEHEGQSAEQTAEAKTFIASQIPAGRMGTVEEIASAVLFLASDESRYMLGAEITVDGGFAQI